MATSLNINDDSFIDIDDFDLDEEGADIICLDDDDADPIILLSDTPLETILEEDKEGD
jgi:hypothetical protein